METILKSLPDLNLRGQIRGDDTVDQFHHYVTVYLLAFAGFLIGLKVPYPLVSGLPGPGSDVPSDDLGELNFYRWVTVIFFAQAFLFKLPALLWSEVNNNSGTKIQKMVSLVTDSTFEAKEKRDAVFASIAEFIETWLKINRKPFRFMRAAIGRRARKILRYCMLCVGGNRGNYLSSMYLLVKFLFLFNVFMQFVILTAFLDFDFWSYGPYAVDVIESDVTNDRFPRIGLCHFQLQSEGHWMQCILSINILLENIFLIEWFWLLLLLLLTSLSFLSWTMRTLQTNLSVGFINKYMVNISDSGSMPEDGDKTINTFVRDYLGNDGIFVLRILATNTNDVAMAALIHNIWKRYLRYDKTSTTDPSPSKEHRKEFNSAAGNGGKDVTTGLDIDKKYTD